jgi:hypothetical protein
MKHCLKQRKIFVPDSGENGVKNQVQGVLYHLTLKICVTSVLLNQLYETSTDSSTHFGKLFVVVGNTELSHNVVSYTTDQKVFVNKTFYSFGGSCVAVKDSSIERFLFVLLHQETQSTV